MFLDILFIAVLLIAVWIGARRGFVRSIIGFLSLLLSIILATFFYQQFLDLVKNTPFLNQLQVQMTIAISQSVTPMLTENLETLPGFILRFIPQATISGGVQTVSDWLAQSLTQVLLYLVFILLLHIVLRICANLLLALTHLPVIRQCNKLLGAGFGAVTGILCCYLLAAIVFILSMNPAYSWVTQELSRSVICQYFYENNLMINLILGIH